MVVVVVEVVAWCCWGVHDFDEHGADAVDDLMLILA